MLYGTGTDTISGSQANYLNSGDAWEGNAVRTCPVGTFGYGENSYFLRDASGNAWEWCHGLYGSGTNVAADPHVLRGGGWGNLDVDIQAGARSGLTPGEARDSVGFRVLTTTDVR
jgi:formylglycine-generating enzyme required for sulfatase activity